MKNLAIVILRKVAHMFILIGIVGSFFYVVATWHNGSIFLKLLFLVWVLLPLFSLLVANLLSRSWSAVTRVALYVLTIFITIVSLLCYSGLLIPIRDKYIFVFFILPIISWLLTATVMPIAASLANKR